MDRSHWMKYLDHCSLLPVVCTRRELKLKEGLGMEPRDSVKGCRHPKGQLWFLSTQPICKFIFWQLICIWEVLALCYSRLSCCQCCWDPISKRLLNCLNCAWESNGRWAWTSATCIGDQCGAASWLRLVHPQLWWPFGECPESLHPSLSWSESLFPTPC